MRAVVGVFWVFLVFSQLAIARSLDLTKIPKESRESIESRFPQVKNQSWTARDLDLIIQFLIQDEKYDAAEAFVTPTGDVVLQVAQIRRIRQVSILGSKLFSDAMLREAFGLREEQPFEPAQLPEATDRLRDLYEKRGYAQTEIDVQTETLPQGQVGLRVTIREGNPLLIDQIKFESPNSALQQSLVGISRQFRGDPLNEGSIANIRGEVRKVLSEQGYVRTLVGDPDIEFQFQQSRVNLKFALEHPERYVLELKGTKKRTASQIRNHLNFSAYFTTNPNLGMELFSRVRDYYLNEGFARVQIELSEQSGREAFTRIIQLEISEGPLVEYEKIEVFGTFSKPADHYANLLTKGAFPIRIGKPYRKEELDKALTELVTGLWNSGFIQARIVSYRALLNDKKDRVQLLVQLDEGPLTMIKDVRYTGAAAFTPERLSLITLLNAGEPLKLDVLEQAIGRLKRFYQEQGFLEVQIRNENKNLVQYSDNNREAVVNFDLSEGPQIRVGSIMIEGNLITKDFVILRELEFARGELLTPEKINRSVSRLQRLGHFNSVEISTLETGTFISDRVVVVRVVDRDPGLFNSGIGVNNERQVTLRGYMGLAYRNIFGTGRGLSGRIDANYNTTEIQYLERKVTLSYLEPYILNTRFRGRMNFSQETQVQDFDESLGTEIRQTFWTLERDLTQNILAMWDVWGIATYRDFSLRENRATSNLDIASTALTFDFDFRDHLFNPTRGTFTRLNVEYSAPWLGSSQSVDYLRTTGTFTHYWPLNRLGTLVWANSVRYGEVINLGRDRQTEVPFDKKGFLLGGQGSIRGFTPSESFPIVSDFNGTYTTSESAQMRLFKTELRFPIYSAVNGAVFSDMGHITTEKFNSGLRRSVGIGARYTTPFGAVNLEFAWKINPQDSRREDPMNYHLSIGTF